MDWKNGLGAIQNKIRGQLFARKIDDLEGVYRLMAEFDKDNSGYLDKDEFQKFLSKIGVFLTVQELRSVYDRYDANRDGNIAYAEFVSLIRENMSEKRVNIVRNAFRFLDRGNQGSLSIDALVKSYNPVNHPRVRTRQKTAVQVQDEFVNAIAKRSSDGRTINENEFLNYYADVNATLPHEKEEYFQDVVISTWGITSGVDYVSPERLAQLEVILFEKIRQKTTTKEDEGKTVRRAFQYFDQTDRGTIDIGQFAQALAKFGCVFSEKEIQAIFNKYDTDHSGKLCYDEFCGLIALMGSGKNANLNPVFQIARQPPYQTLEKIRAELIKKGQHSVRKVARIFSASDKSKNGLLDRGEFQWALKEAGIPLTKTEYDNIFRFFDKNCDDEVSFEEFISFLRVPLSERRQKVVEEAFRKLSDGTGEPVRIEDLKAGYEATRSSDVLNGRKSVADASADFAAQWGTPTVSWPDFVTYYTDVSGLVNDDNSFEALVRGAWRL